MSALDDLRRVTTGTITTLLLKRGIRHSWMRGPMPLAGGGRRVAGQLLAAHAVGNTRMPLAGGGRRVAGPAFTLRFLPVREDLATPESWGKPISTRAAIEDMPEGCVAVADAMGVADAGIFGDILCLRMVKRGVQALVTDGVMRDRAGVLKTGLPLWCAGIAAPPSVNGLTFVGWNEPIACGGCAIFPGDIIVADDDGAVVIPQTMAEAIAQEGLAHEDYEEWVVKEVARGVRLPGLYPMNEETRQRYEAERKKT